MSDVGVARLVEPFVLGFDCLQLVTPAMLDEASAYRFEFVAQYLEVLARSPATRDLIFSRGMAILPLTEATVQEPLSQQTGRDRGVQTVARARSLNMPATVDIVIDLEDPAAGSNVPEHVDAMSVEISGPYGSALYVAVPQPLTGHELYELHPPRYIKGGGRVVDRNGAIAEPDCGWCAIQLEPLEYADLAGQRVDVIVTKRDYRGRGLTLWYPS